MKRSIGKLFVLLAPVLFAPGCVTRTTMSDAPRKPVQFETASGAQTFYEAYLKNDYPSTSRSSLAVGVPLPYWHRTVKTENVNFNRAVDEADANHDGTISQDEARTYAAKLQQQRATEAAACPTCRNG